MNFGDLVTTSVTQSPKFALAAVLIALAAPAAANATTGPGCSPARRAVAHYSGGVVAEPQPMGAPIPCGMQTGFAGGESAVAVTNSGAVFYAPAVQATAGLEAQYFLGGNSGFARTTNLGASWSFVDPIGLNTFPPTVAGVPSQRLSGSLGYPAWDQIDDKFFTDRLTGRLFWTDPDLPNEVCPVDRRRWPDVALLAAPGRIRRRVDAGHDRQAPAQQDERIPGGGLRLRRVRQRRPRRYDHRRGGHLPEVARRRPELDRRRPGLLRLSDRDPSAVRRQD
jgi:hypothetical protein